MTTTVSTKNGRFTMVKISNSGLWDVYKDGKHIKSFNSAIKALEYVSQ
jgi:hypothetical protein